MSLPSFPAKLDVVGLSSGAVASNEAQLSHVVLHAIMGGLGLVQPTLIGSTCNDRNLENGQVNMALLAGRLARLAAYAADTMGVGYGAVFININPLQTNRLNNEADEFDLGRIEGCNLETLQAVLFFCAPDSALLYVNGAGMIGGGAGVLAPWDVRFMNAGAILPGLLAAGLGAVIRTNAQVLAVRALLNKLYTWFVSLSPVLGSVDQCEVLLGSQLDGFFMSRIVTPNGGNQNDRVLGVRSIVTMFNSSEIKAASMQIQKPGSYEGKIIKVPDARYLVTRARLAVENWILVHPNDNYNNMNRGSNDFEAYLSSVASASIHYHGGLVLFYGGLLQHSFPSRIDADELVIRKSQNAYTFNINGKSNTRNILLWNLISTVVGNAAGATSFVGGMLVPNGPYAGASFQVMTGQPAPNITYTTKYVNPFLHVVLMDQLNLSFAHFTVPAATLANSMPNTVARTAYALGAQNRNLFSALREDINLVGVSGYGHAIAAMRVLGSSPSKPFKGNKKDKISKNGAQSHKEKDEMADLNAVEERANA